MLTGNVFRVVLILALLTLAGWATSSYFPTRTTANSDESVESEACKDCHEDQFKKFGYRGISVAGDHNKYRSDLNFNAGARLFDTSFFLKAKDGHNGPAFTNYHIGGNEFMLLSELRSRTDDFRFGADGKLGPIDYSFLQGFRRFRDDSFVSSGANPGININPTTAHLNTFHRDEPTRGSVNHTRLSLHSLVAKRLDPTARYIYSNAKSNSVFSEGFTSVNWNASVSGWPPTPPNSTPNTLNLGTFTIDQDVERPNTIGDFSVTWLAIREFKNFEHLPRGRR